MKGSPKESIKQPMADSRRSTAITERMKMEDGHRPAVIKRMEMEEFQTINKINDQ